MKEGERRSPLPPNKFLVMVLMMAINDIVLYVVAQWGLTPLHIGAFTGNRDIVAELLRQGCDVNAVTSRGETALHYAVRCGQPNIASLVLDDTAGANIINATTFNVSLSSAAFSVGSCSKSLIRHTVRSTQPGRPFVGRRIEYQPKGGDALRLGSKGRYGSCVGGR